MLINDDWVNYVLRRVTATEPWFYAGPYVPSGVIYGEAHWPSQCRWLVPGWQDVHAINGELYPCKPDIFAETYDPLTEEIMDCYQFGKVD
jgi:hypothetical protein